MRILYNTVGKIYEEELCSLMRKEGHHVTTFDNAGSQEAMKEFTASNEEICLMIHISNSNNLSSAIKVSLVFSSER